MSEVGRQPATIHLRDYTPPPWLVDTVTLRFELAEQECHVYSRLALRRNPDHPGGEPALRLDGTGHEPARVALDGRDLDADGYACDADGMTVHGAPEECTLEVETLLRPQENTALEGLYRSGGTYCTQCEAEGFRRITYYPDRPDVMARFTTTIVADPRLCPVMLSNGNDVQRGTLPDGRHWVRWEDPFRKPSYLFALVAGDLACVEDCFITRSGREVALRIYVEHHNADKCAHAMASLKKAMRWDEEVYGLEYDLDIFMIVAVDDFNMGAMENKGLNIFNSKYVLARPDTATDADYANIEGVIAHEYFHNWTGNRVTCRDWFQLSLKEGLTVFRDQQFSADMGSASVKRIQDVRVLRGHQFAEDAGPMAHPVRPQSYIEISNFYTVTVYNKGAELIRMIHALLGRERFRAGMDLYFRRHDGQAVTTDDFVQAMQDATGVDLAQFRRWYDQAGTPEVDTSGEWDPAAGSYTLRLRQRCPATPGQPVKQPFHIPLALGLVGRDGADLPIETDDDVDLTRREDGVVMLNLREPVHVLRFHGLREPPVPSIGRGFSAPVKFNVERGPDELAFLSGHDRDPFNRWDAGQELATRVCLSLIADARAGRELVLPGAFRDAFARTLEDTALDRALVAEALRLPSESNLADRMAVIDVDAIHRVRQFVRETLAADLRDALLRAHDACRSNEPYRFDAPSAGRRALKNVCLGYLAELDVPEMRALAVRQFESADNMTDTLAALGTLANVAGPERDAALSAFEARWRDEPLVLDKWFALQATSRLPDALNKVKRLMTHPRFDLRNPNRVRALVGAFCHANQVRFHDASGAGYLFLAERVLELDPRNPQVAARLAGAFGRWRRFDGARQALMQAAMQRIVGKPDLSRDTYEVVSKTLAAPAA